MDHSNHRIDEYTLAAFLAGTLSEEDRREVVAYLAENADARELLCMAYQALESAQQPDEEPAPAIASAGRARPAAAGADRPTRRQRTRLQRAGRYVLAAVVIVTLGIGLRVALGPPTDALRSTLGRETAALTVRIHTPDLQLRWSAVPDAYQYRVVVWDPQEARVVARHTTSETALGASDAFVRDLRGQLAPSHTYTVRIDAVDAQNRLVLSSEAIDFRLGP